MENLKSLPSPIKYYYFIKLSLIVDHENTYSFALMTLNLTIFRLYFWILPRSFFGLWHTFSSIQFRLRVNFIVCLFLIVSQFIPFWHFFGEFIKIIQKHKANGLASERVLSESTFMKHFIEFYLLKNTIWNNKWTL